MYLPSERRKRCSFHGKCPNFSMRLCLRTRWKLMFANFRLKVMPFWDSDFENRSSQFLHKYHTTQKPSMDKKKIKGIDFSTLAMKWRFNCSIFPNRRSYRGYHLTRALEWIFSLCLSLSFRGRQSTVSIVFHALWQKRFPHPCSLVPSRCLCAFWVRELRLGVRLRRARGLMGRDEGEKTYLIKLFLQILVYFLNFPCWSVT